jgi:hypothetical protein
MTPPVHDPASTKYPGRTFYGGTWMTDEQIDRRRLTAARYWRGPRGIVTQARRNLRQMGVAT